MALPVPSHWSSRAFGPLVSAFALTLAVGLVAPVAAQEATPNPGMAEAAVEESEIQPAPPSIGADIPVTYFGPAPSTVQKEKS